MATSLGQVCTPATFTPSIFGTEIQSIEASLVTRYNATVPAAYRFTQPSADGDSIIVEAWLPPDESSWNGLFQAVGGAGWVAGRGALQYLSMAAVVAEGYATATTDGGLGSAQDPSSWVLLSPGNLNWYLVQDFGARALHEQALFAKALIGSYYGTGPKYSYWNGCSQGGRQGLALAQQYPTVFDGIAAGAPAISLSWVGANLFWAQEWMNLIKEHPYGCEMDAITAAAVAACDGLDGVTDGVIAEPSKCLAHFNPFQVVGTTIQNCSQTGTAKQITEAAASVVNITWNGIFSAQGKSLWPGFFPSADLTGDLTPITSGSGVAATNCTSGVCVGSPNFLVPSWLKYFVAKDPNFNFDNLTHEEFDRIVFSSQQEYQSFLGTNDPDLSEFHRAGGKLLSYHRLADNTIAYGVTERYYQEVSALFPDVQEFFRFYPIPGLGHCFGGRSGQPESLFAQLRAWVENGTAPESTPVSITDLNGQTQNRILCPYPQRPRFEERCGNTGNADCWSCSSSGKRR